MHASVLLAATSAAAIGLSKEFKHTVLHHASCVLLHCGQTVLTLIDSAGSFQGLALKRMNEPVAFQKIEEEAGVCEQLISNNGCI